MTDEGKSIIDKLCKRITDEQDESQRRARPRRFPAVSLRPLRLLTLMHFPRKSAAQSSPFVLICGSSSISVQGHELDHLMTKPCPTN